MGAVILDGVRGRLPRVELCGAGPNDESTIWSLYIATNPDLPTDDPGSRPLQVVIGHMPFGSATIKAMKILREEGFFTKYPQYAGQQMWFFCPGPEGSQGVYAMLIPQDRACSLVKGAMHIDWELIPPPEAVGIENAAITERVNDFEDLRPLRG